MHSENLPGLLVSSSALSELEKPLEPNQVEAYQDGIQRQWEDNSADVFLETADVIALARSNLDFLAAISIPDVYKYEFPPLYHAAWNWVTDTLKKQRDFSQLALGLPRGFAKTLVLKLLVLYAILFTRKQFIMVVCENEEKAVSIISDVADMLNEPNIIAAFGDWKLGMLLNQQAKKVFGYRGRNIMLKAAGSGTGIRGITEKNRRPDVMIFDDIQSREDADSEVLSNKLEMWMIGTAMKAKSPEGCLFLFVANMYPTKGSLLRRLKRNPNWLKFIVGGITEDGLSIWEGLQPIAQLMREFQNDLEAGHPEIFYAEVLNDENATVNSLIDLSQIPPYPYRDDDICQGKFLIVDPSNDKDSSDAVSIGYFEVFDGYPCGIEVHEGRFSPAETIRRCIEIMLRKGASICAIESTAYQYSLNYWFAFICEQMGITGLQPVEVYSGSTGKRTRITNMFRQLVKGEVKAHPNVRPALYLQISQFSPLRRDNVDGLLDLFTYAPKVLELYGTEILNSTIIAEQEFSAHSVLGVEYTSSF